MLDENTPSSTTTPESITSNGHSSDSDSTAKTGSKPKTKSKPKSKTNAAVKKAKSRRPTVRRPFPQNTLEDALAVPQAIKEKNKGKQLEPEFVAKACNGLSPKSEKFFYLAASSRDYGLTN